MSLLLDSAISIGNADPGVPSGNLTHVRLHLRDNDPDRKSIALLFAYGYLDGGSFITSITPSDKKSNHVILGDDWDALVGTHYPDVQLSDPGDATRYKQLDLGGTDVWVEYTYFANKRGLYEKCITDGVIPAGTVV